MSQLSSNDQHLSTKMTFILIFLAIPMIVTFFLFAYDQLEPRTARILSPPKMAIHNGKRFIQWETNIGSETKIKLGGSPDDLKDYFGFATFTHDRIIHKIWIHQPLPRFFYFQIENRNLISEVYRSSDL